MMRLESRSPLRILTWNLNHRSKRPAIPAAVGASVIALDPHVAVFTEYVPGPDRRSFLEQLSAGGLAHTQVSTAPAEKGFNHVLIASREPMAEGAMAPPDYIDPHVGTNALHVRLRRSGVDVLGIRIPDYSKTPRLRRATWDWLESAATRIQSAPAIIIGDLNTDPDYEPSRCGDRFHRMGRLGWTHVMPADGASYWTLRDEPKRLDHAFTSSSIRSRGAQYVTAVGDHRLAGVGALSDHAVLVVDLE